MKITQYTRIIIIFLITYCVSFSQLNSVVEIQSIDDKKVVIESRQQKGTYLVESSVDLSKFFASSVAFFSTTGATSTTWLPRKNLDKEFFRLQGPLEEDVNYELRANINSHSSHLGSLVRPGKFEAHFFGLRNSFGHPSRIERMSVKFEGQPARVFVRPPDVVGTFSSSAKIRLAADDLSDVVIYRKSGFVVVSRSSEDCPAPPDAPVIQLIAYDRSIGQVTFEYPTKFLERRGLNDVYEYEVIIGATAVEHLPNEEAFKDALLEFSSCFIPAANVPTPEDVAIALVCGAISYPNEIKTWPPDFKTTAIVDIYDGKVRASIPVDGDYGTHSSQWVSLYTPIGELIHGGFDDLPSLIIDIPCSPAGGGGALLLVSRDGTRGRYFGQELSPASGASWGELRGGKGVPLAWAWPSVSSLDGLNSGTYGRIRTQAHIEYDSDGRLIVVADSLNIEWLSYSVPMRNGDFIQFSPAISGYPTFSTDWSFKDELVSRIEGIPNLRIRIVDNF